MTEWLSYLSSPALAEFLTKTAMPLILITMMVSFVALLLEMRLPLRYYWGLPNYAFKSVLTGFHLRRAEPIWGVCTIGQDRPLPMVACELLDERTHVVVKRTFSNHLGQFGFPLIPGKYLLRAVKTRYHLPSLFDPENVEVYEIDESFAVSIIVLNREVAPAVDLPLVPVKKMVELNSMEKTTHYLRTFLFQLGNAFLVLDILLALLGYMATQQLFFGLILAVSVILLFIKLYFLETISLVTRGAHA